MSYIRARARVDRVSVPGLERALDMRSVPYWGVFLVGLVADLRKLIVERARDQTNGALVTQTPIEASRKYQNW